MGEWATPAEAPGGARPPWAALSRAALWVSLVGTRLTTGDTFTAGSSEEAFKIFKQSTDQMCIFKRWLCAWSGGWVGRRGPLDPPRRGVARGQGVWPVASGSVKGRHGRKYKEDLGVTPTRCVPWGQRALPWLAQVLDRASVRVALTPWAHLHTPDLQPPSHLRVSHQLTALSVPLEWSLALLHCDSHTAKSLVPPACV